LLMFTTFGRETLGGLRQWLALGYRSLHRNLEFA
jgi:hypothetical protein